MGTLSRDDSGWFGSVPACRLATVRVLVAAITILQHLPHLDRYIRIYYSSEFHVPMLEGLPPAPTPAGWWLLIIVQHAAAWCLLFGLLPRLTAGFLALSGAYVFFLETDHFSHNTWFHLLVLTLFALARNPLTLVGLCDDSAGRARCPGWPERLLRLQLVILMFYAAVDKLFSPFWGLTGGVLADRTFIERVPPLSLIRDWLRQIIDGYPRGMSVSVIALEFYLVAAMLIRPLWRSVPPLTILLLAPIEFLLTPGAFAWDLIAMLVLFLPAADRRYTLLYEEGCPTCRQRQRILARLDWLRRLRWVSWSEARAGEALPVRFAADLSKGGLCLVSPSGCSRRGFRMLRQLLVLFPGPVYVFLAALRFGAFGSYCFGSVPASDMMFLVAFGTLVLWVPGVAWLLDQTLGRWLAHACPAEPVPSELTQSTEAHTPS